MTEEIATTETVVEAGNSSIFEDVMNYETPNEDDEPSVPDVTAEEPAQVPAVIEEPTALAPVEEAPVPAVLESAPEVPATVAEPAVPVPVETPSQQEPVAPAPVTVAAPQPSEPTGLTLEQAQALRTSVTNQLTTQFDKMLTEDEWSELETNPRAIMPKLASGLALWTYEALYFVLGNQLPSTVRGVLDQNATQDSRETAFFTAWPQIGTLANSDPAKAEQLKQIATFWRTQNPNATAKQAIDEIGKLAQAYFELSPAPAEVAPESVPKSPRTPSRASGGPVEPDNSPQDSDLTKVMMYEEPDEDD